MTPKWRKKAVSTMNSVCAYAHLLIIAPRGRGKENPTTDTRIVKRLTEAY